MQARDIQPAKKNEDNSAKFKWNGAAYANNSAPQADRNAAALKVFGLIKGENGLDIGCGNAKTTRQMAEEVYPGTVVGIDNSASMVTKAKEDHSSIPNLRILEGDAASFRFYKPFDFITSFFCLQWVPAELLPQALKNIYADLKENGRICVLLPCYDFTHKIIKGVAFSEKWKKHFEGFKEAQTFFPEDFYRNLLQDIGFTNLDITTVDSHHSLTDEGFINYTRQWCGCYPWLKDEKLRDEFIQDILDRLAVEKHTDGKLDMVQNSIRIIAKKPIATLTVNAEQGEPLRPKF